MSQSYGRMTHLLLGTLLVILLASYSLYTAVRYFYSPYQTMTAFSYTVSDSYTGGAVAVRDEALLDGTADGVLSYVCADGEVIIPGMTIAEVYSGEEDLYWQTMMNQYQNEIRLLNEAQSTPEQFLATDVLSSQINEALGLIIDTVHRGQLGKLSDRRDRLVAPDGKASGCDRTGEGFLPADLLPAGAVPLCEGTDVPKRAGDPDADRRLFLFDSGWVRDNPDHRF